MYKTYPKSGKNPSSKVGEQELGDWTADSNGQGSYSTNNGAKDTVYNGDRSKTLSCEGGKGKPNKSDYPKSRTKFGTEK